MIQYSIFIVKYTSWLLLHHTNHTATHCNTQFVIQCPRFFIQYSIFITHHDYYCTTLHHTATHCSILQHTATHNLFFNFHYSVFNLQYSLLNTHHDYYPNKETRQWLHFCNYTAPYCTTLHHTAPHCTTQFVIQYSLFFTHSSVRLLSPHRLHVCHLGADFSRRDVDGVFSIGTCVSCHSRFRLAAGVFLKNKYKEANPHVSWQALYACIHSTYEFIHTVLAMKFVYFINVCMHT